MSEDKINVGKETSALLTKLGLEPMFVKELHLTPTKATVTVYKRNEDGSKYTEPAEPFLPSDDEEAETFGFSHVAATQIIEFEVRT